MEKWDLEIWAWISGKDQRAPEYSRLWLSLSSVFVFVIVDVKMEVAYLLSENGKMKILTAICFENFVKYSRHLPSV